LNEAECNTVHKNSSSLAAYLLDYYVLVIVFVLILTSSVS